MQNKVIVLIDLSWVLTSFICLILIFCFQNNHDMNEFVLDAILTKNQRTHNNSIYFQFQTFNNTQPYVKFKQNDHVTFTFKLHILRFYQ